MISCVCGRSGVTQARHQFVEDDLQEAREQEEVLPAGDDGDHALPRDDGRGRDPVPVHVHQENVRLGGGRLLHLQHGRGQSHVTLVYVDKLPLLQTGVQGAGIILFIPVFHHFNVNDNIIIIVAAVSAMSGQVSSDWWTQARL